MKSGWPLLSLGGSLLLHGLAVLGVLWLASRESAPTVLLIELSEAIRVGDAASTPGASGVNSPPVVQRRPRLFRSASARPAERVPEPEPLSQPAPTPEPSAASAEPPVSHSETAQPSESQGTGGESFPESMGGGVPGGGPLAMLAQAGPGGEGLSATLAAVGTGGGESGIPAEFGPYLARFRQRVQEALNYPPAARRRGLGGTVHLEIDLLPSGKVASVLVRSSSSHEMLDEAALDTVRRLAPDPFPPGLPSRPLRIRLPIIFELQ